MVRARVFKPLPLCSCTPENLLVAISMSSRNERIARAFKPLPLVSAEKWISEWKKATFNPETCLRKCNRVSQKQWMHPRLVGFLGKKEKPLPLSKTIQHLCHSVQHPRQLTRHFWSSRNERKLLCNQKCVLTKYCEVSQTQWMLELSNLYCVQHPGKLTSRHLCSSRNEKKLICKQKWVLRKWCRVSLKQ